MYKDSNGETDDISDAMVVSGDVLHNGRTCVELLAEAAMINSGRLAVRIDVFDQVLQTCQ